MPGSMGTRGVKWKLSKARRRGVLVRKRRGRE